MSSRFRTRYAHVFTRFRPDAIRPMPTPTPRPQRYPSPTLAEVVDKRWGLFVVCAACQHYVNWTPDFIAGRFYGRMSLGLDQMEARLKCSQPRCGSRNVRVYPADPAQPFVGSPDMREKWHRWHAGADKPPTKAR